MNIRQFENVILAWEYRQLIGQLKFNAEKGNECHIYQDCAQIAREISFIFIDEFKGGKFLCSDELIKRRKNVDEMSILHRDCNRLP